MTRGRCKVNQGDLTRALKAAEAAGVPVKIEFEDGKMTVIMDKFGGRYAKLPPSHHSGRTSKDRLPDS